MVFLCIKDLPESPSNHSNDNRNEIKQPMAFNIVFLSNLTPEVKSLQTIWMLQMTSFIFLFIRMGIYPVLTHKKLLFKNHSLKWRGPQGRQIPWRRIWKITYLGCVCMYTHTHTHGQRQRDAYFIHNVLLFVQSNMT